MTSDEALEWAENGDINAGQRTRDALTLLALTVRSLRTALDEARALAATAHLDSAEQRQRAEIAEREIEASKRQAVSAWERHAEKDRAYGAALAERDRAEMACSDVRLSGGRMLDSALAVASAVAQRAKT